ncbi:MAG TPA: hypothetical protein VF195_02790, partial [Actinomycetota bacterium]
MFTSWKRVAIGALVLVVVVVGLFIVLPLIADWQTVNPRHTSRFPLTLPAVYAAIGWTNTPSHGVPEPTWSPFRA